MGSLNNPSPTAGAVADSVWDEAQAGHTTAGTYGLAAVRSVTKSITFTGAANLGAVGAVPLYTVTGEVLVVALIPRCETNLGEAAATATLALGVTGSTSLFIGATNAVDIDADEFWVDTSPDAAGVALPAALKDIAITADIIGTVAAQAVNAGVLEFVLYWLPLSADANVVAA